MQFFTIIAAFAATAAASAIPNTVPKAEFAPNTLEARQLPPMACLPGLMGTPNCCATVVLGLVGLNCDVRKYFNLIVTVSTPQLADRPLQQPPSLSPMARV